MLHFPFYAQGRAKFITAKLCGAFILLCAIHTPWAEASPSPLPWFPSLDQPAMQLSTPDMYQYSSSAASNAGGTIAATWLEEDSAGTIPSQVMYTSREPGKPFGKPQRISDPAESSRNPRIAMNNRGDVIVAWYADTTSDMEVKIATSTAGRPFTKPQVVDVKSKGTNASLETSINDSGKFVVTVQQAPMGSMSYAVETVVGNIDGAFEKPEVISGNDTSISEVVINNDGRIIVAWGVSPPASKNGYSEAAVRLPGASSFSPARIISEPGSHTLYADLALNSNGDALVATIMIDPAIAAGSYAIQIANSPKGSSTFNPLKRITPLDPSYINDAKLMTNQTGDTAIVWIEQNSAGTDFTVRMADIKTDGTYSKPTTVYYSSKVIANLYAALDNNGDATIVWNENNSSGKGFHIKESHRPKGEAFTKPVTISPETSYPYLEDLTIQKPGSGLVLWSENDGTDSLLKGRMF